MFYRGGVIHRYSSPWRRDFEKGQGLQRERCCVWIITNFCFSCSIILELIDITCTLLLLNPDFTTAWNVRYVALSKWHQKDLSLMFESAVSFVLSGNQWHSNSFSAEGMLNISSMLYALQIVSDCLFNIYTYNYIYIYIGSAGWRLHCCMWRHMFGSHFEGLEVPLNCQSSSLLSVKEGHL